MFCTAKWYLDDLFWVNWAFCWNVNSDWIIYWYTRWNEVEKTVHGLYNSSVKYESFLQNVTRFFSHFHHPYTYYVFSDVCLSVCSQREGVCDPPNSWEPPAPYPMDKVHGHLGPPLHTSIGKRGVVFNWNAFLLLKCSKKHFVVARGLGSKLSKRVVIRAG